jgi:hypothetical protein
VNHVTPSSIDMLLGQGCSNPPNNCHPWSVIIKQVFCPGVVFLATTPTFPKTLKNCAFLPPGVAVLGTQAIGNARKYNIYACCSNAIILWNWQDNINTYNVYPRILCILYFASRVCGSTKETHYLCEALRLVSNIVYTVSISAGCRIYRWMNFRLTDTPICRLGVSLPTQPYYWPAVYRKRDVPV